MHATTVQDTPALSIRAIVLLRPKLQGLRSETRQLVTRVRVIRLGSAGQWRGILLGAPFCDASPLGMGHVPFLGRHYFKALKFMTTRLEDSTIQSVLEGQMVGMCQAVRPVPLSPPAVRGEGTEHSVSQAPTICEVSSADAVESSLPLYALAAEPCPDSLEGEVLAGRLVGVVSAEASMLRSSRWTAERALAPWPSRWSRPRLRKTSSWKSRRTSPR